MSDSFLRNALRQRLRAIAIADDRRSGSLSITFDRAFPGFDGHFAEQSIVPGLCFIQLAVILAEEIRSQPTRLAEIIRLKSLKPIQPEESVNLALTRWPAEPRRRGNDLRGSAGQADVLHSAAAF
ncbi:MAG: hypothetical protein ACOX6W_06585 [Lentisphaeria bacterium]